MRSLLLPLVLVPLLACAQFDMQFDQSVPVTRNGNSLVLPWAGGYNFVQFSQIDLDGDGDLDLFSFDRSGDEVVTLLNNGGSGQPNYVYTRQFEHTYPFRELHDWALLRDYNCDGKPDIFSYSLGGMAVYKNTTDADGLSFVEVDTLVRSNYQPTMANLYITQVDIPGIEDIDNDGDLDVITFSIFGSYVEYHRNLSMELYGVCDSLKYEIRNRCWGFFSENLNNNSVTLEDSCNYNVPNPEMPLLIEEATDQLRRAYHNPAMIDAERAHTGSTTLPIDLDDDQVKDILLGDILYPNLTALFNGGTVDHSHMTSQDTIFPIYDQSAEVQIFPAAFYVDLTNDGKRDLLVSPNNTTLSQDYQSVWYYKNIGSDAAPVFDFQDSSLFQRQMLDVGEGALPVLFDYNGDGLMDIIITDFGYYAQGGNYPCKMALLQNTGTATQPAFTFVTDDYEGLSGIGIGQAMYPAFGDIDNDGDKDMYIGDLQGKMHFFRNVATGPVADFTLITANIQDDNGVVMDVGQFATPQFFDMDGDGKLDLVVGERNGNINYYHNTGSLTAPAWHLQNDSLGGVVAAEYWNITGYSVPFMYHNNAGETELLVGSESGWIHQYDNIDGNLNGTFNQVDSTWQDIKEGSRSGVALYDFNGDGYLDGVTGNYRGGLAFYKNDFAASVAGTDWNTDNAFTLYPNPSSGSTEIMLNVPAVPGMTLTLLNDVGQEVLATRVRTTRSSLRTDGLRNGVYVVRLEADGHRWTQRLVVLH